MAKTVTKVWIKTEDCTSCEACVAACPEVFEMKNDVASVIAGVDIAANSQGIIEAADSCPCEAIKYEAT